MDDKLVTLAIRTYQRAQMIKAVLEENGIETVIHNLNLEHPELAVGVRVRIKESDLPRALKIVEGMESSDNEPSDNNRGEEVLITVDFADLVESSIDFGFNFAKNLNAEVTLLYVYFSPTFTISEYRDVSTYSITDSEITRRIVSTANADVKNMENLINARIAKAELPDVPFHFEVKEGVPEDQILDYCKKNKPAMVVMGTHGKNISTELIGSVTAEVMEFSVSPVFAVPLPVTLRSPDDIKRVAFLTNFDQKDLIAIDKTIELCKSSELELYFIHASDKNEKWNEVMLGGIKSYFDNHYPQLSTHYSLIGSVASPELIDEFLKNNKIDLLAFNTRRRRLFSRLFNSGLAYKLVLNSDTMLFVTHI